MEKPQQFILKHTLPDNKPHHTWATAIGHTNHYAEGQACWV